MKTIYKKIANTLEQIIHKEYQATVNLPLWELPARQEFGDLSSMAAMKLASVIGKNPLEIAEHLKMCLEQELGNEIDKIEIMKPGFINVFFSPAVLRESLQILLREKEKFFRRKEEKKVLLEFVSANPTGPLSVAHGRQAIVGDVIGNILEFFGDEVTREYYINDAGHQIDLLVLSVEARMKEIKGEPFTFPEDGYHGEYIKDIAQAYLKNPGADLRTFVLSHALEIIKEDLAQLGIVFDTWFSQQKLLDDKKVEQAVSALKEKGLIYENEGAVWFASTQFGDDKDRVIKKSDGELTYFASDIAYHKDKIERRYDHLINLWGPDHHGYIPRVKASIKAFGHDDKFLEVIIIQLVSIKTKERMSRRKGTAVLLADITESIGKDAARFYYLLRRNSSHLEFNVDLAKEASFNNPLYYIQYACARIESIFKKAQIADRTVDDVRYLKEEEEIVLMREILQFSYCLEKVYYSLEPVWIIEYLKNIATALHKFYEKKRVIVDDVNITRARLNLLDAAKIVLHCALKILGVTPAEKM